MGGIGGACCGKAVLLLIVSLLLVQGQSDSDSCVNDGQAPTITALSISPTRADVTNRAREVRVRFTVTDEGAAIDLCSASLRSPDRQHPQFVVLSGEAEDARSCSPDGRTCDMNLLGRVRPNVVSGRWSLELSCRDSPCEPSQPRNEFVLAGQQLVALGFPGHVTVESGEPDVEPPAVRAFRFVEAGSTTDTLDTVHVQDGPFTIGLFYTVTDDISGIESCLVTLRSPDAAVRATFTGTESCTSDRRRCSFTQTTTLQSNSPSGAWEPVVFCRDGVQNRVLLSSDDLNQLGFPFRLNVVTLVPDNTPPELLQFSFSPPQVNIATGPAEVETSIVVLDVESMLADCSVMFHSREGQQVGVGLSGQQSCSSDHQRCVYSKKVVIPARAAAGAWRPTVLCGDVLQNRMVWGPTQLQKAGFSSILHVTDATEDARAPELQSLQISPPVVDVAHGSARVSLEVDVSDASSVIDGCIALLHGPEGQSAAMATTSALCSTPRACVYTMAGTVLQGAAAGEWRLSLACRDGPGNGFAYWAEELAGLGFTSSLTVIASARDDTIAPQLISFGVETESVSVGEDVVATLTVTDSGKNIASCAVVFMDGNANLLFLDGDRSCNSDDARQSCLFYVRGRVPRGATAGVWDAAVSCSDASGNSFSYNHEQLAAAGQDHQLTVISPGNVAIQAGRS